MKKDHARAQKNLFHLGIILSVAWPFWLGWAMGAAGFLIGWRKTLMDCSEGRKAAP